MILCGTDLSPASAGALDVAIAFAQRRGDTELVLLHALDPRGLAPEGAPARARALEAARAALDAQALARAQAMDAGALELRTELIVGPPDETIVALADSEGAALVVVTAHSQAHSLLRLGTTTAKVIAHAHVPVLVIRDPAPWLAFARQERPLRLMLGIDESASCDLGIQWTHALRELGPVEVVLGAIYYPDTTAEHYGEHTKSMVDRDPELERLLARDLLRRFGDGDGVQARPRRGLGRIGDHLLELAHEERVDAIVVGTGQKTGLGRLGSVSSVVVDGAPQSVVCVPPDARVPTRRVPSIKTAVVATDLSGFANRAVPFAFAVSDPDATVHIIHVVPPDEQVDVNEIAARLAAISPIGASQQIETHVVHGADAAVTLAQCAAKLGADVICIASHGRSGLTRALVGSVADRLLRATRLPVLVLRPA